MSTLKTINVQHPSATSPNITLDSSGNVGIGTSSPTAKLDVSTSINLGQSYYNIGYDVGSGSGWLSGYNVTYNSGIKNVATGALNAIYYASDSVRIYTNSSAAAGTTASERMRIDASGNVGIGTNSFSTYPSSKLVTYAATGDVWNSTDAVAATGASGFHFYNNGVLRGEINTGGTSFASWGGASSFNFLGFAAAPMTFATNSTERMRIDSSGNVGIGFSSGLGTYGQLEIGGSTNPTMALRSSSASGTVFAFTSVGATEARINALTNVPMTFFTNNTERMRIDNSGNVIAGASAALATTATNGFLYVPTCAGTPTGTPTTVTGMAPIVVNTTNNKLYFYSGGAWRDAGP